MQRGRLFGRVLVVRAVNALHQPDVDHVEDVLERTVTGPDLFIHHLGEVEYLFRKVWFAYRAVHARFVLFVEPDMGRWCRIIFDPQTVEGAVIKEDAEYSGVRVVFLGYLGKAKINMRLDVGFADVVTPHPNEIEFQTILEGSSKPCIRAYPPETVIAEKFQAMVDLGMANSRLKDFYDLWFMASTMEFDYGLLMEAITSTFKNRGTPLPESTSPALTEEFAVQKQIQWVSFLKKSQIVDAPTSLYDVIQGLTRFFTPLVNPNGEVFRHWSPTTGWFK